MKAMKIEGFGGKVCSCDKIEVIVRESERKSKSVGAGESKEEWPWLVSPGNRQLICREKGKAHHSHGA